MPLFGTDYESEMDKDQMAFIARFSNGYWMTLRPHMCDSHEKRNEDHRGALDLTVTVHDDIYGTEVETTEVIHIPLELASALVEGIGEIGPLVQLNQELG